jgi:hypothetical protein
MNIADSSLSNETQSQVDPQAEDFANDISGNCNLIVNYLPHDIDDNNLRVRFLDLSFFLLLTCLQELFEEFGEIIMTKVVRDKNTKKSLGYGFVKFGAEYNALIAIDKMNGFTLGHKLLKVSVARPPSLDIRNCKLYVTNLPKDYTEVEIISLFKEVSECYCSFFSALSPRITVWRHHRMSRVKRS